MITSSIRHCCCSIRRTYSSQEVSNKTILLQNGQKKTIREILDETEKELGIKPLMSAKERAEILKERFPDKWVLTSDSSLKECIKIVEEQSIPFLKYFNEKYFKKGIDSSE